MDERNCPMAIHYVRFYFLISYEAKSTKRVTSKQVHMHVKDVNTSLSIESQVAKSYSVNTTIVLYNNNNNNMAKPLRKLTLQKKKTWGSWGWHETEKVDVSLILTILCSYILLITTTALLCLKKASRPILLYSKGYYFV